MVDVPLISVHGSTDCGHALKNQGKIFIKNPKYSLSIYTLTCFTEKLFLVTNQEFVLKIPYGKMEKISKLTPLSSFSAHLLMFNF